MNIETSTTPDDSVSLDEALDTANAELGGEVPEQIDAPPPLPQLEAPARWSKEAKDAWAAAQGIEGTRPHLEHVHKQWGETQKYLTQQEQYRAHLERQWNPINELLQPHAPQWAMQGMDPQAGLRQVLSYANQLASNPQETLLGLAEMYGVDLRQALEDAPYVDPVAAQAMQRLQQFEQHFAQREQMQSEQQQQALIQALDAFERAVDADGTPKHPHFRAVLDDMVYLSSTGRAKSPEEAYERACRYSPEVSEKVASEAARKASADAIRNAQLRTGRTREAVAASSSIKGKGGKPPVAPKSLDEALSEAMAEASAKF